MLLIRRGQGLLENFVRLGENLLHGSALLAEQLAHNVAALLRKHCAAHGGNAVVNGHGGGLLGVVDLDLIPQVFQSRAVRPHHQADGLAHIQHIVLGKAAPVLHDHPQLVFALRGDVLGGDEVVALRHLRQVDGVNGASGDRGAHHIGVLHVRQHHVADIGRLPSGFFHSVHPNDLIADFRCWHCIASLMYVL